MQITQKKKLFRDRAQVTAHQPLSRPVMMVVQGGDIAAALAVLKNTLEEVDMLEHCQIEALSPNDKFRKAELEPYRERILRLARSDDVKILCTVGPDVFKHLLGRGKKPSMKTLQGSVLREKLIDYKTVVPFSDINPFNLPFPQDEPKFVQRRFIEWINNCAQDLLHCAGVLRNTFNEKLT